MNQKKWTVFPFLIIMLIAFVLTIVISINKEKLLKRSPVITNGRVIAIDPVVRGDGLDVKYELNVEGEIKNYKRTIFIESKYKIKLRELLVNKCLPVVYEKGDEQNNLLLISKNDYQKFGVLRTDSIQNLLRFIDSLSYGKR